MKDVNRKKLFRSENGWSKIFSRTEDVYRLDNYNISITVIFRETFIFIDIYNGNKGQYIKTIDFNMEDSVEKFKETINREFILYIANK